MDKVLKACPFCGAPGHEYVDAAGYWMTECSKCDTAGPDGVEAWNRRPIEDALRAECDAAVARAEAAEAEAERLRGLLSAERDGYAAGVADGRKAGAGEERDLIVACLRDFEKNGPPGLLSGAAQHIEAGCHWPDPLKPVW
jgi:hypothetical protein